MTDRAREVDHMPPCMDFDNPGPHQWTRKRCGACGKLEPLEAPQGLTLDQRQVAKRLFDVIQRSMDEYDELRELLTDLLTPAVQEPK